MYNAPFASVLWFLSVLMLSVYTGRYFGLTYIRCSDVPVSVESGRYNTQDKENLDNAEYKSRRPIIKNFRKLGVDNSERRSQEYRIIVKNSEYWLMNGNPTADETCRRYLSPARLVEWIIDKDHGDSSDTVMKLCSADPWKHAKQTKSEERARVLSTERTSHRQSQA